MKQQYSVEELQKICLEMRKDILSMCYRCGKEKAHLGGCMSIVELLAVLYKNIIYFDFNDFENRDRFILSKGHAGIALYAALKQAGLLSEEEIHAPMRGPNTITYRHPKMNPCKGIEISSGSLGLGISYAVGLSLAFQRKKRRDSKVYVLLGDGECNEGSVWESAMLAGHLKLENLIVIIDRNGLQLDGNTEEIIQEKNMSERWNAFGFDTMEIDGHNLMEIQEAFCKVHHRPLAIIAHTVKGKGVPFAENKVEWHDNYLSDALYQFALNYLENNL